MPRTVLPVTKSLLIADSVFRQASGKWCIIGVFDRIIARSFPVLHPSLGLFLQISDVLPGEHQISMAFKDSQENTIAVSPEVRLVVKDRLARIGIGLQTHNLLIPREDTYFIEVLFDDSHLEEIRLQAEITDGGEP